MACCPIERHRGMIIRTPKTPWDPWEETRARLLHAQAREVGEEEVG